MASTKQSGFTRRQLLRTGLTATASTFLVGGLDLAFPTEAPAQSKLTPDAALADLMAGNKRFTSGKMTAYEHDLVILKQHTEEKQEPFAAVLSCADSRVPVELVFDQTIGHIFVTRVAGNVITPEIIGSLEYGAAVLGTKVILVMGHANCGAVKATMQGKDVPGQISSLFPHIQPGVDQGGKEPVRGRLLQVRRLADLSETGATLIARAKQNQDRCDPLHHLRRCILRHLRLRTENAPRSCYNSIFSEKIVAFSEF